MFYTVNEQTNEHSCIAREISNYVRNVWKKATVREERLIEEGR